MQQPVGTLEVGLHNPAVPEVARSRVAEVVAVRRLAAAARIHEQEEPHSRAAEPVQGEDCTREQEIIENFTCQRLWFRS